MDEDEFARRFFEQDLSDIPQSGSAQAEEESDSGAGAATGPPRRTGRHPAMMVAVMVFSALLSWMFWDDTAYWLSGQGSGEAAAGPVDIGDSVQWRAQFQSDPTFAPDALRHNRYIRVGGLTAFRTEAAAKQQAFLKIAYLPIYVHLQNEPPSRPTDHLVHLTVSGRLIDMSRTGRYRGVQRFYAEQFGLPTRSAFMMVAEDKPANYWWSPLLQGLFGAFILANGAMLVRTLRRT